jgi:Family of unknown function (DUF6600)
MKAILKSLMVGLVGSFSVVALTAHADLEVSAAVNIHAAADFYAPLASHGAWVEVGSYGRCWRPAGVAVRWHPYCDGHWVWTDCGWYWASDEPWGWACYHYGRWVYDPTYAWVWVPGIEWAPAWVSWRVGGGYIGWAPLPPHGVAVAAPSFVFVGAARFDGPIRPSTVIANNAAIIKKTTVINNIKQETKTIGAAGPQRVVVNEGPGLALVQKASRSKIKAVPIGDAARQATLPASLSHGRADLKTGGKPGIPAVEPRKSAPKYALPPSGRWNPPANRPPPRIEKKLPREGPAIAPNSPPTPVKPPETGPRPSEGKGEGKNHEHEGGHHGKE